MPCGVPEEVEGGMRTSGSAKNRDGQSPSGVIAWQQTHSLCTAPGASVFLDGDLGNTLRRKRSHPMAPLDPAGEEVALQARGAEEVTWEILRAKKSLPQVG